MTYVGGSRKDTKTEAACFAVIRLLAGSEPLGVRAIQDQLMPDHPRDAVRMAIKQCVGTAVIAVDPGKNNAQLRVGAVAVRPPNPARPAMQANRHPARASVRLASRHRKDHAVKLSSAMITDPAVAAAALTQKCGLCRAPAGQPCTNTVRPGEPLPGRTVHHFRITNTVERPAP
jgi:hypothetical protein